MSWRPRALCLLGAAVPLAGGTTAAGAVGLARLAVAPLLSLAGGCATAF